MTSGFPGNHYQYKQGIVELGRGNTTHRPSASPSLLWLSVSPKEENNPHFTLPAPSSCSLIMSGAARIVSHICKELCDPSTGIFFLFCSSVSACSSWFQQLIMSSCFSYLKATQIYTFTSTTIIPTFPNSSVEWMPVFPKQTLMTVQYTTDPGARMVFFNDKSSFALITV